MKIKSFIMNLNEKNIHDKELSGLLELFNSIKSGNVEQQKMLSYGFNLNNPSANTEYRIAQTISVALDFNLTEDEIKLGLRKIGLKKISDLIEEWNKSRGIV